MDQEDRKDQDHATAEDEEATTQGANMALGISIGVALGAAIGLLMDNLALGMGVGLALGAALGGGLMAARDEAKSQSTTDEE